MHGCLYKKIVRQTPSLRQRCYRAFLCATALIGVNLGLGGWLLSRVMLDLTWGILAPLVAVVAGLLAAITFLEVTEP